MKNTKGQKGITLIALIITIIVLLILAVVAISAVQEDGIINYAKNARGDYEVAQGKENTILQNYLDKIKENVPTSTGSEQTPSDEGTPIIFTIDGTEYQATSNQTWAQWCEGRTDYHVNKMGPDTYMISPREKNENLPGEERVECNNCVRAPYASDGVGKCKYCHGTTYKVDC